MEDNNLNQGLFEFEQLKALVDQMEKTKKKKYKGRRYIRVNTKYYKIIDRTLKLYNKETIIGETPKDFWRTIPAYDGFVNEPQYFNFQQEITKEEGIYWNLHNPIPYTPEEGKWPTIEKLLRHLFQNQYEMGLDWIQILLTKPKQPLPVPCLVSEEQETGKTSFLNLLSYLIPGNTASISISDFVEAFNSHFCSKHVVMIDETEADKMVTAKGISSKLKRWVTQETVIRNEKHGAQEEIEFYGKLVICSNREENFIRVEKEDTRYWIVKVPLIKGKRDPEFFTKMKDECKHFVHFLSQRTLATPTKQGRLWFSTEQIRTEAFESAAEYGKSSLYHDLRELILEDLQNLNLDTYFYSSTELGRLLTPTKHRYDKKFMYYVMTKEFNKPQETKKIGKQTKRGWNFTVTELESVTLLKPEKLNQTISNGKVLF